MAFSLAVDPNPPMPVLYASGAGGANYSTFLGPQPGQPGAFPTPAPPNVGPFPGAAPTPTKYGDFTAPDPLTFTKSPDYQFRLAEGQRALEHSAAARGSYFTPNTMRSLTDYGQGTASAEYGNAYNRALQTYGTNRDTSQQYFGNQLGAYHANLAGYQASTDAELARHAQEMGGAGGAWDRNFTLARTQHDYTAAHEAEAAVQKAQLDAEIRARQAAGTARPPLLPLAPTPTYHLPPAPMAPYGRFALGSR